MAFPLPEPWTLDAADFSRHEAKRSSSPCSYFYSQAQAIGLASGYFHDGRLMAAAHGQVARKHRHRIHLALFGQLMAAFEYMLKDFVARAVDTTTVLDGPIEKAKWLDLSAAKILAARSGSTSPGSILVHSTLGWHSPTTVNERYQTIFNVEPIDPGYVPDLERLWILRHSVAHNAGYVTGYDASRIGSAVLANNVADIDARFIGATRDFLVPIARRLAHEVGGALVKRWLATVAQDGPDYARDEATYKALKKLSTMVESRTQDVPEATEAEYNQEFQSPDA